MNATQTITREAKLREQAASHIQDAHDALIGAMRHADQLTDRSLHREIGAAALMLADVRASLTEAEVEL